MLNNATLEKLRIELIKAEIVGSYQQRELIMQGTRLPQLKVYMYKEEHKLPHVHVHYGPDSRASIAIDDQNVLAGQIKSKYLQVVGGWIQDNRDELMQTWGAIQAGRKPELNWSANM